MNQIFQTVDQDRQQDKYKIKLKKRLLKQIKRHGECFQYPCKHQIPENKKI
jgi:hypothetical protein